MKIKMQERENAGYTILDVPAHPGVYVLWMDRLFVMSRDDEQLYLERDHTVILNPNDAHRDQAQRA